MILSIIVISHNQKEELKRCLMSILSQSLPFEFEIIISDDNSNDGSWEVAQEFASCYPQISAYSCNTNDFHPANTSERSGWNRCNGYKHAKGKYIAHIDGDDFLLEGTDIYKKQVELLEKNPNCSCCMANDYDLDEGQDISKIKIRHKKVFQTGDILPSEEYIKHFFRESHCFVYRRQEKINPVERRLSYNRPSHTVRRYHMSKRSWIRVCPLSNIYMVTTKEEERSYRFRTCYLYGYSHP